MCLHRRPKYKILTSRFYFSCNLSLNANTENVCASQIVLWLIIAFFLSISPLVIACVPLWPLASASYSSLIVSSIITCSSQSLTCCKACSRVRLTAASCICFFFKYSYINRDPLAVSPYIWQFLHDWQLGEGCSAAACPRCLSCHVGGVNWVITWESKVPFSSARGDIRKAPFGLAQGGPSHFCICEAVWLVKQA